MLYFILYLLVDSWSQFFSLLSSIYEEAEMLFCMVFDINTMPLLQIGFKRKVLMLFIEIKEKLRKIGKNVEPDTVFHMPTLATEEDFKNLER